MWYVCIIRSIEFPEQEYTGATADLKRRISDHNAGKSTHTAKFKPWKLVWYCAFPDKYKALEFEKYLNPIRAGLLQKSASANYLPVNLGGRFSTKLATPSRKSLPCSDTIISRLASMVASARVWNGTSYSCRLMTAIALGETKSARSRA